MGRRLGFDAKTQIPVALFSKMGCTGSAFALMLLAAALEEAKSGDRFLLASYGDGWDQKLKPMPSTDPDLEQAHTPIAPPRPDLPDDLIELTYSAIDQLYGTPNLNEAMRRLRLARVRAGATDRALVDILDNALDQIEAPSPQIKEVIWYLEEKLADLNIA